MAEVTLAEWEKTTDVLVPENIRKICANALRKYYWAISQKPAADLTALQIEMLKAAAKPGTGVAEAVIDYCFDVPADDINAAFAVDEANNVWAEAIGVTVIDAGGEVAYPCDIEYLEATEE